MSRTRLTLLAAAAASAAVAPAARAAFTPGDLVVVQLGGTTANAQAVTLLDYSLAGGTATLVGSHPIDSTSAVAELTLSGTGAHDGHLNVSADGRYLLLGGYRAAAGSANPINQSSGTIARVVGRIDANFNVDTTTALTDAYNGGEFDAVASVDGSSFYLGGDNAGVATSGGLRYATLGATTTTNLSQTQATGGTLAPDSLRNTKLVNGQLYVLTASQGSFGNRGLYATATPLPNATSGPQALTGVMNDVEGSTTLKGQELAPDSTGKLVPKTDVVFADLSAAVPGFDTAYTTGGKAEFEKWSLIAGAGANGGYGWLQVGVFSLGNGIDVNALGLSGSGSAKTIYTATAGGIYAYSDAAGYIGAQPTAAAGAFTLTNTTPLIAAAAGTQFRGIAVPTAVPEPASLAAFAAAGLLLGRRRRAR